MSPLPKVSIVRASCTTLKTQPITGTGIIKSAQNKTIGSKEKRSLIGHILWSSENSVKKWIVEKEKSDWLFFPRMHWAFISDWLVLLCSRFNIERGPEQGTKVKEVVEWELEMETWNDNTNKNKYSRFCFWFYFGPALVSNLGGRRILPYSVSMEGCLSRTAVPTTMSMRARFAVCKRIF
jgi:hypothetical protein